MLLKRTTKYWNLRLRLVEKPKVDDVVRKMLMSVYTIEAYMMVYIFKKQFPASKVYDHFLLDLFLFWIQIVSFIEVFFSFY